VTINHYKCLGCSLTHLCPVDSPILLNWINLFPKVGVSGIFISIFRIFLTEISLSKQRRPRWDAALCGVSSGSTLFAMSFFQDARHEWVNIINARFWSNCLYLVVITMILIKLKRFFHKLTLHVLFLSFREYIIVSLSSLNILKMI